MHPDEIEEIEAPQPGADRRPETKPAVPPLRWDPYAFTTWAEARKAFPYHALICIVDLAEDAPLVTPIFPQPDCSDLALDGRTWVVGWLNGDGEELADRDLPEVLRAYDPGPFTPRR